MASYPDGEGGWVGSGEWYDVTESSPPPGLLVQVPNNEGAILRRRGWLWFLPDDSMYVYYTPTQWRPNPLDSAEGSR